MWQVDPLQILAAILLDLLLGDPRGWPHIARLVGWISNVYEKVLTSCFGRSILLGALFWVLVVGTMLAGYGVLWHLIMAWNPIAAWIFNALVIYQTIAAMDLAHHVKAVLRPLSKGDLPVARHRLSWIVGRDTANLDEGEISRAAIESVAESTTDAVVAPLFWAIVGGAPGALIYRTANTLDSLVGHRTEAYEKFGKASARLDDVLNWLPARIGGVAFSLLSSAVHWNAVRKEAAGHASPNAGWTEAAMAQALGVRLGGENWYDGQLINGPVFNVNGRRTTASDIRGSLFWMWLVAGACAAGLITVRFALLILF